MFLKIGYFIIVEHILWRLIANPSRTLSHILTQGCKAVYEILLKISGSILPATWRKNITGNSTLTLEYSDSQSLFGEKENISVEASKFR